ncbi:MAG: ornithine cyclodeaminase family protein [Rhodospirillales bacterium]|nr:ornithine cyclodeaminase family protein [Rhodospirillales bacterium]
MANTQPFLKTTTAKPAGTLLLTRRDVADLLNIKTCIAAVERALACHAAGETLPPGILGIHAPNGGFHIKAAGLRLGRLYFAAKTNGNFSDNPVRLGLPAIQGTIVLCDGDTGYPLAVMDSIEISAQRTAAATAVAAKYLARPDSATATICGCGTQGRVQLAALACVLPLARAFAHDRDRRQAEAFARDMSAALGFPVTPAADMADAIRQSDVCVTCTPSRRAFLNRDAVAAGTFIAAVGADAPDKQELDPALLAAGKVVVDLLDQCATIGDLHHALDAGVMTRADVHAELADLVAGRKPGRESADEITIFDSTGTALQDVAAAIAVYERALAAGRGTIINFAD